MTIPLDVCSSTSSVRRIARAAAIVVLVAVAALDVRLGARQAEPPELGQARQLFDALEYEQAIPLLDRAIAGLELTAARDQASRKALVSAYEMRARARFGIGNRDGASADFRSLLAIDPSFQLGEGVSPRIVALLDEVKATTIGTVELSTDPGDVTVLVDGAPANAAGGKVGLASGAHTLTVSRPGYRSIDQPLVITAGQSVPLRLTLERVSTVLTVVTSPPDVEVAVNGAPKGATASGPLAPSLTGLPAAARRSPRPAVAAPGGHRSGNRRPRHRAAAALLRHGAPAGHGRGPQRRDARPGGPEGVGRHAGHR